MALWRSKDKSLTAEFHSPACVGACSNKSGAPYGGFWACNHDESYCSYGQSYSN